MPSTSSALVINNQENKAEHFQLWVGKFGENFNQMCYLCMWNECHCPFNNIEELQDHINRHVENENYLASSNQGNFI